MAYVGAGAYAQTGVSATLALSAPAFTYDAGAGQVLFMVCVTGDDAPTIALPSGFDGTVINDNYDSASRDVRYAIFYRIAQSGDSGASFNVVKSANDFTTFGGKIWLQDGIDTADILNTTAAVAAEVVGTTATLAAYDPVESGQLIHVAICQDTGTANSDFTTSPPASSTIRFDDGAGTTGAAAQTIAMADRTTDGTALGSTSWGTHTSCTTIGITFAVNNAASASAAVTGTAGDGCTETQIVTGGETIILTLTGDTWVASGGTFNAIRQDIIDGIDSAQSEANGWDAERGDIAVTDVARTSDTVVTITLPALASYAITANETITVTIPASALTGGSPIVASPTFVINSDAGPGLTGPLVEHSRFTTSRLMRSPLVRS
jgi:hypothetical protein